ncbi:MAG: hypothetical protein ACR2IE_14015 [Candidatus Sumerlaeaceae bacterium]
MPLKQVPDLNASEQRPWSVMRTRLVEQRPTLPYLLGVILAFTCIAASRCVWFTEMDFFMHHRVGRWIWEHRAVPHQDYFCFMTLGNPWIAYEWLFELMQYLVQHWLGWSALAIIRVLAATLTYVLVWRTARLLGVGRAFSLVAPVVAAAFGMVNIEFRPHAATNLLFAAGMYLVIRSMVTGKARHLLFLPPMLALWANMHGGFVAFLASAGLMFGGEAARRWWSVPDPVYPAPSRRLLLRCFGALALAVMMTGVTPYLWRVWEVPLRILSHKEMSGVLEWQAIRLDRHLPFVFFVALTLALALANWRRLHPGHALLLAAWAILSCTAQRHTGLFAIVAAPLACMYAESVAQRIAPAARLRTGGLLAALLVVIALGQAWIYNRVDGYPIPKSLGLGMHPTATARKACEFIRREHLPVQLYNDYNLAGYLIYWLHPDYLVFQDSRLEVVGEKLFRLGQHVEGGAFPLWRETLDKHGINTLVVSYESGDKPDSLVAQLDASADFALVYWDDQCLVYLRKLAVANELVERLAYRAVKPGQPTFRGPQDVAGMQAALAEVRRKRHEDPACRWAARLEGYYVNRPGM